MSYLYYDGPEGVHYCYAKEPTYTCRHDRQKSGDDEEHPPMADPLEAGVIAAGMKPEFIRRLLAREHQRQGRWRDPKTDRLTERCGACGAKLRRRGFAVWTETPAPDPDTSTARISSRLSEVFGGDGIHRVHSDHKYVDTKKEARALALRRLNDARAADHG